MTEFKAFSSSFVLFVRGSTSYALSLQVLPAYIHDSKPHQLKLHGFLNMDNRKCNINITAGRTCENKTYEVEPRPNSMCLCLRRIPIPCIVCKTSMPALLSRVTHGLQVRTSWETTGTDSYSHPRVFTNIGYDISFYQDCDGITPCF